MPETKADDAITEEWLAEVGFKWHQLKRQPTKHWLLWLGDTIDGMFTGYEDLGVELVEWTDGGWHCWIRSDTSHKYHRFIHVRTLFRKEELIRLIEGLTGQMWDPRLVIAGSLRTVEQAKKIGEINERFDKQLLRENPTWYEAEEDDTRGGALPGHLNDTLNQQKD